MVIGGFKLEDNGVYGLTVSEYEAGWSFFLDGDDAEYFRDEWRKAAEYGSTFREFLIDHEYYTLFQ